ncbi:hypothetical protein Tco_1528358, partial [Tanacetum coccineum]
LTDDSKDETCAIAFQIPSESNGISESECDLPVCDDSSPKKDEVLDDIISIALGNGNDHFNDESSLIESVLNRDNVISSPKIDFLLEEFAGELALITPIPPGIIEADFDPKGDIHFIENLMYDNSFPRPPETLEDDSETVIDSNNDYSSSDNDSLYSDWKRISHKRTKNKAKNDKTKHGMEMCEKKKPKSQPSQKVNRKVKQSKSESTSRN